MRKAKDGNLINNDQWNEFMKGAEHFMKRECELAGRDVYGSDWSQCVEQIAWDLSEIPDFDVDAYIDALWE
ncbi:MAG TPA: hypothetical protein QGG35_06285 [Candidatus Marinimicrobia bacterium]|jgi:hypothetical protein|nr:hypothetical protein [Candidatus Neomarinimicrobiota bacterium]